VVHVVILCHFKKIWGQKLFHPMILAVNFMTARPSSGVALDISYCNSKMRSLQQAQALNCVSYPQT
jgi:hypothetical protein